MSSIDVTKTPDARKDQFVHGDDHKDLGSDTDPQHSVSRNSKAVMSPSVDLKNIQFIEPAEGTPAALALAANAAIKVTKFEKGLHKFRGLKRPKMKSLNIVKKINKTTKNKRKKRHFSKNFKGKVIDGVHELYTLTAGMMLGINHLLGITVTEEGHEPSREAAQEDFSQVIAVPFPAKGSTEGEFITPPHKLVHTFNFKSYAPRIFSKIRHFFDVDVNSYQQSVCGDYNYVEFISNSKSGQFFFYSHDGRYMLKTQTKEENKFLLSILPQYYEYLRENPNSLLVRILGMHRVNMYHLRRKVHFVIMASVFDTPAKIHTIYDLKGSLAGRAATPREREGGGVLKDMDLLHDKRKFHLGAKKPEFIAQLRKDAEFLAKLNIMDYSLLVGVHYRSQRPQMEPAAVNSSITGSEKNLVNLIVPVQSHSNLPFRRGSISAGEDPLHITIGHDTLPGHTSDSEGINLSTPTNIQVQRRASSRRMSANRGSPVRNMPLQTYSSDAHDDKSGPNTAPSSNPNNSVSQNTTSSNDASRVLFPDKFDMNGHLINNNSVPSSGPSSAAPSQRSSLADGIILSAALASGGVAATGGTTGGKLPSMGEEDPGHEEGGEVGESGDYEEGDDDYDGEEDDYDGEEDEFEDIDEGDSDREVDTSRFSPAMVAHRWSLSSQQSHLSHLPAIGSTTTDNANQPAHHHRKRRPWTDRVDLGINCHTRAGRGDEIYFVGVIDILQQYNVQKRFESMVKGIFGDVRTISAIDAPSYARRFVRFIDQNTD